MEEKKPLKYFGYAIVLEEVPDEISLAFNISGCMHRCEGCHSQYLWEYKGEYLKIDLQNIISKYGGLISCVCFLGGDQNVQELYDLCKIVKSNKLKTCIYSGENSIDIFKPLIKSELLDYLKIGEYNNKLGPLNNRNTNQKMYKIDKNTIVDITYLFQKYYINDNG